MMRASRTYPLYFKLKMLTICHSLCGAETQLELVCAYDSKALPSNSQNHNAHLDAYSHIYELFISSRVLQINKLKNNL